MHFSMLLFGLYRLLWVASLTNKGFKKHIQNTNLRLLIKTKDNSRGRLIVFDGGKVSSEPGARHDFDVALVFRNAHTGFSVLTDRKSDAVFNAAARGDMHLEGMSAWAMWFEATMKIIM